MKARIVARRPALTVALVAMAFLVGIAISGPLPPAAEAVRHPERVRLNALIHDEQARVARLRDEVLALRQQVNAAPRQDHALPESLTSALDDARRAAGLTKLEGSGLVVSLDDAREAVARLDPDSAVNLNDFVVHSQDVQAVANALWAAGVEAMAVNGERIVPTSALLCVGNTLLLNGTVHAPPYRFSALGDPDVLLAGFKDDPLVKRLQTDADRFGLGFSVHRAAHLSVPRYRGSTTLDHAESSS